MVSTLVELGAQTLLFRAELGGEFRAEVVGFGDRTNLELRILARHRIGTATRPLDRFIDRLDLPEPETRDELLGFRERSIDDAALGPRDLDGLVPFELVQLTRGTGRQRRPSSPRQR